MRIAYKSIIFLLVFFKLIFLGNAFASMNILQQNYKNIQSQQMLEGEEATGGTEASVTIVEDETEGDSEQQQGDEANQNVAEQINYDSEQAVIIVDEFRPKDSLVSYKDKYLRDTITIGSSRFFTSTKIKYKHLKNFASSEGAEVVLLKIVDFNNNKEASERYYYDILFLSLDQEASLPSNLKSPWLRTSSELQDFPAPTSMFKFLSQEKRIFIKEQSRIMLEYGLKTQADFDMFLTAYKENIAEQEQQKAIENGEDKEAVEEQEPKQEPAQEVEVEANAENAEVEEGQDQNNDAQEEIEVVESAVEVIQQGSEEDILDLQDLYFTTLEGRWVDIATGYVFDIVALTDYNEGYKGYDDYDSKESKESLYDLDSAQKSISVYSPAFTKQKNRDYVVYTAYYVGNALNAVKDYNRQYAKRKDEKIDFQYLESSYNKETPWANEELVLEFNTKTQSGVYINENKVPVPAKFKAYPHRGYMAAKLANGDVRYILPIKIAQNVDLPLMPANADQQSQAAIDEENPEISSDPNAGEVNEIEEGEEGGLEQTNSQEEYYDPYVYDSRFNSIAYLNNVPLYKQNKSAYNNDKPKMFKDNFIFFLTPMVLIFGVLAIAI